MESHSRMDKVIDLNAARAERLARRARETRRRRMVSLRGFAWVYVLFLAGGWTFLTFPAVRHAVFGPTLPPGDGYVSHVIDGDTIVWKGRRIRLHGLDAPEMDQTCRDASGEIYMCGWRARRHLKEIIGGRPVYCDRLATDRYGRDIAVCLVEGTDIGERMVRDGWAVAYSRYSMAYEKAEREARRHGRGLWSGSFTLPETWRHGS